MSARSDLDPHFEVALRAAHEAGEEIARQRNAGTVEASRKEDSSILTSADLAADKIITDAIRGAFPSPTILSEESSPHLKGELLTGPLWIIDPIDGTTNYSRGSRHCAVSIAYAEGGEVQLAVVSAPFYGELLTARRGEGAFCNGARIHPRKTSQMEDALIATGFHPGIREALGRNVKRLKMVLERCHDIRRTGSAVLDTCAVARGTLDAYFESVKPWDIAAARLIATEAGARAGFTADHPGEISESMPSEIEGRDFFVAAPSLFEILRDALMEIR